MTPSQRGGRGRRGVLVTSALLVVGGGATMTWAVANQNPDPPAPPAAASSLEPTDSAPTSSASPSVAAPDSSPTGSASPDSSSSSSAPTKAAPSEDDPASPSPSGSATSSPSASAEGGQSATALEPLPKSEPVAVRAPSIGVDAPLHALGLNSDGTLEVPSGARYDEPAWYSGSPTPGEIGPTVIEGHVTGAGGRPSVFFELGAVEPGDSIEVDREDGSTVTFRVDRVEQHPKDDFPTARVYGHTDRSELRVITCGGVWNEQTGSHDDNIVVFAQRIA